MKRDQISGLVLVGVGLFAAFGATRLPLGTLNHPDSGFFPLLLASLLALLGTLVLKGSIGSVSASTRIEWGEGVPRIGLVILLLLAYGLLLERVGYVLLTGCLMAALLKGVEQLSWRATLAFAIPTVLLSYALFRSLGVPLPQGILSM